MNKSALAKRDADAQNIIVTQAEAIAEALSLPEGATAPLRPQHRSGEVRAMLQREALAVFLGQVVKALEIRNKRSK